MKSQVIIGTRAGSVIGSVNEMSQDEVDLLKNGLKELMGDLNYLELNTDRGWVIVPGANVQFVELVLVEE